MKHELCSVGYTFRNYPAEFAFAQARQHGYAMAELRDYRGSGWGSLPEVRSTVSELAQTARLFGVVPWAGFHVIDIPSPERSAQALDEYRELIGALAAQRIRIWHTRVRLPGIDDSSAATDAHYVGAAAFLDQLGALADGAGVVIAIESHMWTIHDTAAAHWRLLSACRSPAVTASIDFANLAIANAHEDLEGVIARFAGRIGYVHLKAMTRRAGGWDWNLPLRAGDIDYRRLLPVLSAHYAGPLGVEYCGPGDPAWVAADDAAYLREIMGC